MGDQRIDREGGADLRANVWLNVVVMLGLVMAAFNHGIHAAQGHSYLAAALAILDIACIYLLSLNIAKWSRRR
jgi:hypothetical protein